MLLRLDPDSALGLADQIANQVRGAIVAEQVSPGDKLPAARDLAAALDVNMHTVLRAYAMLRDEGLVDVRRGRGATVRADVDPDRARLDDQIRDLVTAASRLGLTRAQLVHRLEQVG